MIVNLKSQLLFELSAFFHFGSPYKYIWSSSVFFPHISTVNGIWKYVGHDTFDAQAHWFCLFFYHPLNKYDRHLKRYVNAVSASILLKNTACSFYNSK